MLIIKITILLVVALTVKSTILTEQPLQDWPQRFTQLFYDTNSNGKLSVDYKNKNMKFQRFNGISQPICSTYLPNVTTPCNHLINNGTKYIVYPDKSLCCRCCNIEDPKCFYFRQNWLHNSTYTGVKSQSWEFYDSWSINYDGKIFEYWTLQGDDKPARIYNRVDGLLMSLGPYSHNTSQIPKEVFKVPDYCNKDCAASNYCSAKKQNLEILE